jgi:hypothetical protein
MLHRHCLLEDDVTYILGSVVGGLESARVAGADGRTTMAEREEGTTFSNLQKRVTQMKKRRL